MALSRFLMAYVPRRLGSSMVSGSAPPCAGNGLVTPCTKAMDCLSHGSWPAPTLRAAAPQPLRDLHPVGAGRRNPVLSSFPEADFALDWIAHVMARGRRRVEEV